MMLSMSLILFGLVGLGLFVGIIVIIVLIVKYQSNYPPLPPLPPSNGGLTPIGGKCPVCPTNGCFCDGPLPCWKMLPGTQQSDPFYIKKGQSCLSFNKNCKKPGCVATYTTCDADNDKWMNAPNGKLKHLASGLYIGVGFGSDPNTPTSLLLQESNSNQTQLWLKYDNEGRIATAFNGACIDSAHSFDQTCSADTSKGWTFTNSI